MREIILSLMLLAINIQAQEVYATFTVEAKKSANLAFTSSGTLNNVMVEVSSLVKKGDMLASLQNDDLRAALHIATTALKYTKKDYDRQIKVKKLVDASKFDSYAFKYESAKAQVIYQQALLDKTILKAPFDGIIFYKSVEEGDVVSSAMIRTLFKIQSKYNGKLVLEFDQKYWKHVNIGDTFKYKVDGDPKEHEGIISKIHPHDDPLSRKMKEEVEVKNLIAGLFGDGIITTQNK